jgi:hypothetical protein
MCPGLGERQESRPGACQTILYCACPRFRQVGLIVSGNALSIPITRMSRVRLSSGTLSNYIFMSRPKWCNENLDSVG